jgi:Ca-activated chloride channel family protein
MTDEKKMFGLASREDGAPAPVLCGVRADGRLDGLLFELTLRQTYRNTSQDLLEVVYTFPLPSQAVLLGFASELNGRRQVGAVVGKRAAERQYEKALAEGDAPVMLESLGGGLHTANIGNLKPGDELVLEVRYAQLLAFDQGRLRLAIPTTIAPRYGNAEAAGLQPQQVPQASLLAEYPLALSVTLAGSLAGGTVECPTHRFTRQAVDGGLRLELAAGAWLDRDVVIVVVPKEASPSIVIQAADVVAKAAPVVLMAAMQPPLTTPRERIALKLLVDCSGSMAGDSIASAKAAVHGVLDGMTEHDHLSVTRFGTTVRHLLVPTACSRATLRYLRPDVDALSANLGGTEMAKALQAVFGLPVPRACDGADVLLLTDGEIWQANEMIDAARASGHRVFAIGVGSSPTEALLRSLAESTGGACEFATPGEALEAAAARMLVRIRQQPWREARIDWGCEPVWQTALPKQVFGGDTAIAFAGLTAAAVAPTVRLLAVDVQGAQIEVALDAADAVSAGDTLSRIAAARRITTVDIVQAQQLAVDYQLLTPHTNCILVHERAEADKATEQAELHRVASMLAAGWGATSTVMASAASTQGATLGVMNSVAYNCASLSAPSVFRSARTRAASRVDALASNGMDDIDIPAFLRKQSDGTPPASLQDMVDAVFEHVNGGHGIQGLATHCAALELRADAQRALDQAVAVGFSLDEAWLLLAHWANGRPGDRADSLVAAIAAVLQPHFDAFEAAAAAACAALFDQMLGAYRSDSWALLRTRRLGQALSRSMP